MKKQNHPDSFTFVGELQREYSGEVVTLAMHERRQKANEHPHGDREMVLADRPAVFILSKYVTNIV